MRLREIEAVHGLGEGGVVLEVVDHERLAARGHLLQDEHVEARPGAVLGRGEPRGARADDDQVTLRCHPAPPSPRGAYQNPVLMGRKRLPIIVGKEWNRRWMHARPASWAHCARAWTARPACSATSWATWIGSAPRSRRRTGRAASSWPRGSTGWPAASSARKPSGPAVVADLAAALGMAPGTPLSTIVGRLEPVRAPAARGERSTPAHRGVPAEDRHRAGSATRRRPSRGPSDGCSRASSRAAGARIYGPQGRPSVPTGAVLVDHSL